MDKILGDNGGNGDVSKINEEFNNRKFGVMKHKKGENILDEDEKVEIDTDKVLNNFKHLVEQLNNWKDYENGKELIDDIISGKNGDDGNGNEKGKELLDALKNMPLVQEKQQLYPVGRVLWFVPEEAVDDENGEGYEKLIRMEEFSEINGFGIPSTFDILFDQNVQNREVKDGGKKGKYVMCDVTKYRSIFQNLHTPMPDSLICHLPPKYLSVLDTQLQEVVNE